MRKAGTVEFTVQVNVNPSNALQLNHTTMNSSLQLNQLDPVVDSGVVPFKVTIMERYRYSCLINEYS